MTTGRRAFDGATQASLISAIMRDAPRPMAELAPMSPPGLERVVLQCLAKAPDDRWQTAGDVKRALEWSGASESGAAARAAGSPARARPGLVVLALALVAGALLATGAWWLLAPRTPRLATAVLEWIRTLMPARTSLRLR
jgi:hypothetical protein